MSTVGKTTRRATRDGSKAEPAWSVAAGPLENELGLRLGRAARALREAWGAEIADLGLTPPQAAMLRAVCEERGSGIRDLGRCTRTDAMNAKRLVDHLERAGLLESVADPAHRQRRVLRPTDAGAALAAEVSQRAARWNRRLARLLGADGLRTLRDLLGRLEDAVAAPSGRRLDEGSRPTRRQQARRSVSASASSGRRAPPGPTPG